MGYHASAAGCITVAEDTAYIAQRLSEVFEIYKVTNNIIDFGVTDAPYHSDEVRTLLQEIAPSCWDGEITYHGDDDYATWRFVLKNRLTGHIWLEQQGRIVYDDPSAPAALVPTPLGSLEVYITKEPDDPEAAILFRKPDGELFDLCCAKVPFGEGCIKIVTFPDTDDEDGVETKIGNDRLGGKRS